jgi:hypothetical protein
VGLLAVLLPSFVIGLLLLPIFSSDIMSKAWFNELDLDDLRQKRYTAPFKPNTSTLDNLVELSSSIHDMKIEI